MSLVTTRAVVLQTYRYSDTSKILRLMSFELGPCSALARGALRPKSRFGGLLEPFVEGDATFYAKEGRDLHTLSGFELVRERRGLGQSLQLFTVASVLCELVMRLAPEHRDDDLYRSLTDGLDGLHARLGDDATRVGSSNGAAPTGFGSLDGPAAFPCAEPSGGLEYIWAMVEALGFRPELESCVACGRPIGATRARFDFAAGGLQCGSCAPSGPGLDAAQLADLRALVAGRPATARDGSQGRWLADFIRYHLAEGATLRSLPFLRDLG